MTMTSQNIVSRPSQADLDAALLLLNRLGITPADLLGGSTARPPAPTFAEYVPVVAEGVSPASRRAYGHYWNRIVQVWGDRRIDEPTPSEIKQLGEQLRAKRIVRANDRGGHNTVENFITALRCLYNHAVADRLIRADDNPARKVDKPRRLASLRHAVPDERLAEINRIVATTGNDPALDTLLVRLHIETACRRGGALALRPIDLDPEQCLIRLREKGDTVRWQPVSPTLMAHLQAHAHERQAPATERLLRYRDGTPITHRRYDYIWKRVSAHLPWAATQRVSTHWLRHTTLTWVERNFGYAVARAYAGHTEHDGIGTTATYVKASLREVAAALAALTGEEHPLCREHDPT